MAVPLRPVAGGVLVDVHAQPGARRDEVGGLHGDRLRVRTTAPPEDGRANARIGEILAAALGVARARVELVAGGTSRRKTFRVDGLALAAAEHALAVAEARGARAPRPRRGE